MFFSSRPSGSERKAVRDAARISTHSKRSGELFGWKMAGVDQGAQPWIIYDAPLSMFLLYPVEGAWGLVDTLVLKGARDLGRLVANVLTFSCAWEKRSKDVQDGFADVYNDVTDESMPQPSEQELRAYNEITSSLRNDNNGSTGGGTVSQTEIDARKFLANLGLWDDPIPETPTAPARK